jgi:hypothetical protein
MAGGGRRVVPGFLLHEARVVEGVGLAGQVAQAAGQRQACWRPPSAARAALRAALMPSATTRCHQLSPRRHSPPPAGQPQPSRGAEGSPSTPRQPFPLLDCQALLA